MKFTTPPLKPPREFIPMVDDAKPAAADPPVVSPYIGARVMYWPPGNVPITHRGDEPLAATVVRVWSDTLVNIAGYDATGNHFPKQRVTFWQGDGDRPEAGHEDFTGGFCEWPEHYEGWKKSEAERVERERKAAEAEAEKPEAEPITAGIAASEAHPNTWVDPSPDRGTMGLARTETMAEVTKRNADPNAPQPGGWDPNAPVFGDRSAQRAETADREELV